MNKRGEDSQEWITNDGIIKLLAGVAILIFLIFLGFKLFSMFSNPEGVQAQKNFDLLINRINYIHDNKITLPEASLLYTLPQGSFYIMGFDAKDAGKTINFEKEGTVIVKSISRPANCDDKSACLCLTKSVNEVPQIISCKNIPYEIISMKSNLPNVEFSDGGFYTLEQEIKVNLLKKQDATYPVFLSKQMCEACLVPSVVNMNFILKAENNMVFSLDNLK